MKVLIYLEEKKLTPTGGPLAVGYYYHQEIAANKDLEIDFITKSERENYAVKTAKRCSDYFPKWLNHIVRSIRKVILINNYFKRNLNDNIDYQKYDIIHFHQTGDMYEVRQRLANYKGIVILQSHSPIPWYQEQMEKIPGWAKFFIKNYNLKFEGIDIYAFNRADYIVFPCSEAEEPYDLCWPFFREFKNKNLSKFKYVLTGINPPSVRENRVSVLNKYNIPQNSFIISYIGRHNSVKGYDILKIIAEKYFGKNQNAFVIAAGAEAPYTRLVHNRWKEIGFTKDPHSIINASDVFVLPNRMTYFDIVMIEVLSLGKIIVASNTGGNRFFRDKTQGVFLYNTVEEALDILDRISQLSNEERTRLGKCNYDFYDSNLKSCHMYHNYKILLSSIYTPVKE